MAKELISASKAAAIIRILSDPRDRDPRFVEYVVEKIARGKEREACSKRQ